MDLRRFGLRCQVIVMVCEYVIYVYTSGEHLKVILHLDGASQPSKHSMQAFFQLRGIMQRSSAHLSSGVARR